LILRPESERVATFNFGGGALYDVNPRLAVRFDARDYLYEPSDLSSSSLVALQLPARISETINDLSLNAGLSVRF
jgi:hypothetical protein